MSRRPEDSRDDLAHEPLWPTPSGKRSGNAPSHLLVPPFGAPLPLPAVAGKAVVIGRDEACEIRIASPTVSRRHAEIRFRGTPPRAYLTDLGTMNGTRLNGAKVKGERTLTSEDVLRLGDVTAIYRVVKSGAPIDEEEPKPRDEALDLTLPLGVEKRSLNGLTGDARLLPLDGLLGRLTIVRASGRLELDVDGTSGHLVMKDGSIVEAGFGGRDGNVAIRAIAALRRGRFQFHEDGEGEPQATESERVATFSRVGATWLVALPGSAPIHVAHVRGLAMIERLLAHPEKAIEALELVQEPAEAPAKGKARAAAKEESLGKRREANASAGPAVDAKARRAYEKRARELEDLVKDGHGGPSVTEELAEIARQLASGGGAATDGERARSTATHAIKRALASIREAEVGSGVRAAPIARHLEEAITTGARSVYRPAAGAPDAWRLTGGIVVSTSPPHLGRVSSRS